MCVACLEDDSSSSPSEAAEAGEADAAESSSKSSPPRQGAELPLLAEPKDYAGSPQEWNEWVDTVQLALRYKATAEADRDVKPIDSAFREWDWSLQAAEAHKFVGVIRHEAEWVDPHNRFEAEQAEFAPTRLKTGTPSSKRIRFSCATCSTRWLPKRRMILRRRCWISRSYARHLLLTGP